MVALRHWKWFNMRLNIISFVSGILFTGVCFPLLFIPWNDQWTFLASEYLIILSLNSNGQNRIAYKLSVINFQLGETMNDCYACLFEHIVTRSFQKYMSTNKSRFFHTSYFGRKMIQTNFLWYFLLLFQHTYIYSLYSYWALQILPPLFSLCSEKYTPFLYVVTLYECFSSTYLDLTGVFCFAFLLAMTWNLRISLELRLHEFHWHLQF